MLSVNQQIEYMHSDDSFFDLSRPEARVQSLPETLPRNPENRGALDPCCSIGKSPGYCGKQTIAVVDAFFAEPRHCLELP
jgi:hypothetical protein